MATPSLIEVPVATAFTAGPGVPLLAEELSLSVLKDSGVVRLLGAYRVDMPPDGDDRVLVPAAILAALAMRPSVSAFKVDVLPVRLWGSFMSVNTIKRVLESVDNEIHTAFSFLGADTQPHQLLYVFDEVASKFPNAQVRALGAADFVPVQPASALAPVSEAASKIANMTFGQVVGGGNGGGQAVLAALIGATSAFGRAADRGTGKSFDLVMNAVVSLVPTPARDRDHIENVVTKKLLHLLELPLRHPFGVFAEEQLQDLLDFANELAVVATAASAIACELPTIVLMYPHVKQLISGAGNPHGVISRLASAVFKSDSLTFHTLEGLEHFLSDYDADLNERPFDANEAVASIIQRNDLRKAQVAAIVASGEGAAGGGSVGSASKLLNEEIMVFESETYKRAADQMLAANAQDGSVGVLGAAAKIDAQVMTKIRVSRKSLGRGDLVGNLFQGALAAGSTFLELALRTGTHDASLKAPPNSKFGNSAIIVTDKDAGTLLKGGFSTFPWDKYATDYFLSTTKGARKKFGSGTQRFVDLPDLTLRLDVILVLLRAAGVPESHVMVLASYVNDMTKYSVDTPELREEVDRVMKAFFSTLERDWAAAAGSPLSAAPIKLRSGHTSEAGVLFDVFDKNRAIDHETSQASFRSPTSKRGKPDSDRSPPTGSAKTAAIQRVDSGGAARVDSGEGAFAVTSMAKWSPGDKLDKVRVSKDRNLLAIGPFVYDNKKLVDDITNKASQQKRASFLELKAVFLLSKGNASVDQRLVYAPKGTAKGAVTGFPFKGFKALDYFKKGVSVVEADF